MNVSYVQARLAGADSDTGNFVMLEPRGELLYPPTLEHLRVRNAIEVKPTVAQWQEIVDRIARTRESRELSGRRVPGLMVDEVLDTIEKQEGVVPSIDRELFQERLKSDPFWMLVACSLATRSRWSIARPIFGVLRSRWQHPYSFARADGQELAGLLEPLGLQNVRSQNLRAFAASWVEHKPTSGKEVEAMPGMGQYARHSWNIFIDEVRPHDLVNDKALSSHLARVKLEEDVGKFKIEGSKVLQTEDGIGSEQELHDDKSVTMGQLVDIYNNNTNAPVKRFADRKSAAKRVWPLLAKAAEPVVAKTKKTSSPKAEGAGRGRKPMTGNITVVGIKEGGKKKHFNKDSLRSKCFEIAKKTKTVDAYVSSCVKAEIATAGQARGAMAKMVIDGLITVSQ